MVTTLTVGSTELCIELSNQYAVHNKFNIVGQLYSNNKNNFKKEHTENT